LTFRFFAGSYSSPDEDRLLKHLFHPDHQLHDPMTTPIANKNQTIHVSVGIEILKFVALVSFNIFFAPNIFFLLKFVDGLRCICKHFRIIEFTDYRCQHLRTIVLR